MNTIRDVITLALKKLSVIRGSGQPKAQDAADALASLASFYNELISNGTCGRVWAVPVTQAFDGNAGHNQHINIITEDTVEIDLPDLMPWAWCCNWRPSRDYGWGLSIPYNVGERMPPDMSVVRITSKNDDNRATYLYDAPVQRWMRIDNLNIPDQNAVLNREAPLSSRNMDGLAALLATRIADQFGQDLLSALTLQAANRYKMALVSRYGEADNAWCGDYVG